MGKQCTNPRWRRGQGTSANKFSTIDRDIILPSNRPVNSVDFAISVQTNSHNSKRATPKQIEYLNNLRRAIGLPRWNGAKQLLAINVPGTHELSQGDASRLIDVINFVISGGA